MNSCFVEVGKSQVYVMDECQGLGFLDEAFHTAWTLCICAWFLSARLVRASVFGESV